VPIFPELLPRQRECSEQAEPGSERVITRYADNNQNLRTQLERIISRAGLHRSILGNIVTVDGSTTTTSLRRSG
jgi:hypothetical protein